MDMLSALLALCEENLPVPGGFPSQKVSKGPMLSSVKPSRVQLHKSDSFYDQSIFYQSTIGFENDRIKWTNKKSSFEV